MKLYNQTTIMSLEEYQSSKDFPSDRVGQFFTLRERAIKSSTIIYSPLLEFLDELRATVNRPLTLTSLHRSIEKQAELTKQGYKTAGHSPHLYGCAVDIDTKSKIQTLNLVKTIQELADKNNRKIRLGYQQYLDNGQTFVHLDFCPEVFNTGIYSELPFIPNAFKQTLTW